MDGETLDDKMTKKQVSHSMKSMMSKPYPYFPLTIFCSDLMVQSRKVSKPNASSGKLSCVICSGKNNVSSILLCIDYRINN